MTDLRSLDVATTPANTAVVRIGACISISRKNNALSVVARGYVAGGQCYIQSKWQ